MKRKPGLHVAIIMDGSGRWACARGLPRSAGHRAGMDAVRRTVAAAPSLGISSLTLFAFSSDNWRRPASEVAGLMRHFEEYLEADTPLLTAAGTRLTVSGRRDRLPLSLLEAIHDAEAETEDGRNLHIRLAIDYSAREAIVEAVRRTGEGLELTRESLERSLSQTCHAGDRARVDLLIRTSGEQRLSDFMLWECAYAELHFTPRLWPDFDASDLRAAVNDFHSRQRRFGGLLEAAG